MPRRVEIEREDVEKKINEAYAILHNKNQAEEIPDRLWNALEGISSIILAHKKSKGAPGWSQSLIDLEGKPLFTSNEQVVLETSMKNFDDIQKGGDLSNVKTGTTSSLVTGVPTINPEDVSIDKIYHTIDNTLNKYDDQWREIAGSLGVVKAVEAQDYKGTFIIPFVPPIPIPFYVLGKAIFPFLNVVLEFMRIAVSDTIWDVPTARVLLSIAVAILDLLRGEWKNAVLTLLGTYSSNAALAGFGLKLIHNAYLFIAPDLQKQLKDTIYRSSKSMTVGFLLWSFTCFAPDFVRFAADQSFAKLRDIVAGMNDKIQAAEDQAQGVAEAAGVKVSFPKVPLDVIPSIDDIQNLQTIARVPEIYCSREVQDILQPLLLIPPLRLAIELLNIPTVEEDVTSMCRGIDTSAIETSIVDMATPDVSVIPGGILNQAASAAATAKEAANTAKAAANAVSDPEALAKTAAKKAANNLSKKAKKAAKNALKPRKTRKNRKAL